MHVIWWAINETRVDVAVRSGSDEWRIVYGTQDAETIDWLSVFKRPPKFEGVLGGRVVIVNGASGAGKSTLMQAIQTQSPLPWVVFDEPHLGSVDRGYLIWRDTAEVLHRGFLAGIAALARAGNLIAVAAAGHPQSLFKDTFAGIPVVYVGLDCDVATLKAPEVGREGRWGGLAEASVVVHDGWRYDLRFDTTVDAPSDIAREVLRIAEIRTSGE